MACVAAMVDFSAANESIPYANGNVVTRRHVARSRTSARKQRAKEPRVGRAVACETLRLKTILLTVLFLLIIISIILAFVHVCWGNCDDGPPDTMYPLPPSPSRLHKFQKAAVCTDGPPCSAIGRHRIHHILVSMVVRHEYAIVSFIQKRLEKQQSTDVTSRPISTQYALPYKIAARRNRTPLLCIQSTSANTQIICDQCSCVSFHTRKNPHNPVIMSENHFDEYEHYNFEYDKHIYSGHSGKQRTKKEASTHTNHFDPSGHSRKIVTKLMNTESNKKTEPAKN